MNDTDRDQTQLDNTAVRASAVRMEMFNRRARLMEVILVAIAAAGVVFLVVTDTLDRRDARKQNLARAARAEQTALFAADAVQCIVGQLIDHRIADRDIHDKVLEGIGGPDINDVLPPAVLNDPLFPAGPELQRACARFKTEIEDHDQPPATTTTRRK